MNKDFGCCCGILADMIMDILHNRMQEAGMQFLSWVMHLTFVTHIFLLYHIIRI